MSAPGCSNLRYSYLFDPPAAERLTPEDRARYELAAILCRTCPVLEACAKDRLAAKSAGYRHGVLYVFGRNGKPMPVSLTGPKPKPPPRTTYSTRTERVCIDCKRLKPLDAFPRDLNRFDGHGSYCKPCRVTRERSRRRAA
jgi:hypothetical protein